MMSIIKIQCFYLKTVGPGFPGLDQQQYGWMGMLIGPLVTWEFAPLEILENLGICWKVKGYLWNRSSSMDIF